MFLIRRISNLNNYSIVLTSSWKFALVNSKELSRAVVAAKRTWLLVSDCLMPCTMAVRIWFDCPTNTS